MGSVTRIDGQCINFLKISMARQSRKSISQEAANHQSEKSIFPEYHFAAGRLRPKIIFPKYRTYTCVANGEFSRNPEKTSAEIALWPQIGRRPQSGHSHIFADRTPIAKNFADVNFSQISLRPYNRSRSGHLRPFENWPPTTKIPANAEISLVSVPRYCASRNQ